MHFVALPANRNGENKLVNIIPFSVQHSVLKKLLDVVIHFETMKILVIVNSLTIVCVAAAMDPGSVMNAVRASVGKVYHLAHHIEKRQTFSSFTYEDFIRCSSAIVEHQCSSGYAQETINIALGCGNTTAARETSVTCARNEGGQACGAAVLNFSVNDNQTQNAETCSRATSGSCPSTCRMFLQFARSELGCCFNTLINTTDSPYYRYSEYADYPVWNWCNIDLPPAACGNTLPLNPPSNAQTCTFSEYFNRTVNYECMASVGQPLVDVLLRTSRCYPYARRLIDACGTNANGEFCAQLIGQNLLASISAIPCSSP